jgi:hypothetical protein
MQGRTETRDRVETLRDDTCSVCLVEAELTGKIIGAAVDVHRELGSRLLESAYQACMCRELSLREIPYGAQVDLPVQIFDL